MRDTDDFLAVKHVLTSLHDLVSRNQEMRAELLRFHEERSLQFIPSKFLADRGFEKDKLGYEHKSYKHMDESCCSDSELTEEESSSGSESLISSGLSSPVYRLNRVRFAMDEEPQSRQQVLLVRYSSDPDPITPEERNLLWYNSRDFRQFRRYANKCAEIAANSSYGLELLHVLNTVDNATNQDVTHLSRIANTVVRGLEAVVADGLVIKRCSAIRAVLDAQASCRPGDDREAVLCTTSKAVSRSSRILARVLGNGDAAVARAVYREN